MHTCVFWGGIFATSIRVCVCMCACECVCFYVWKTSCVSIFFLFFLGRVVVYSMCIGVCVFVRVCMYVSVFVSVCVCERVCA